MDHLADFPLLRQACSQLLSRNARRGVGARLRRWRLSPHDAADVLADGLGAWVVTSDERELLREMDRAHDRLRARWSRELPTPMPVVEVLRDKR